MSFVNGVHTTSIRVRYAETDQMGLVYNAHYLTWFEVARTEFLRELGLTYRETEKRGFMLPLRQSGVKYHKPARYDDIVTIRTMIGAKPGARILLEYMVYRGEELLATGFTEHACTDRELRPIRPPGDILQKLRCCWKQEYCPDKE